MVQYFSKEFFDELANRVNTDPEWTKKGANITAKLMFTITDRGKSYLLVIVSGKVAPSEAAADAAADFKFEGPYDAWATLGRAEKDFQSLVIGGKIKFRGSMPKMMGMLSQLNRITFLAQQMPKEF